MEAESSHGANRVFERKDGTGISVGHPDPALCAATGHGGTFSKHLSRVSFGTDGSGSIFRLSSAIRAAQLRQLQTSQLEEPSEIIESNHSLSTAKATTNPHTQVTPPPPQTAYARD